MKIITLLLNASLLAMIAAMLAKHGWPVDDRDALFAALAIAAPVFTLAFLSTLRAKKEKWLIALILERKRLEEQAKISRLSS